MVKMINLTPHEIVLCGIILPSEGLARCQSFVEKIAEIDGISVNRRWFGEVTGLPEPQEGTIFIVSAIVAQAVAGKRDDVFVTDDPIRNENNQIIGCKALAKI